MQGMQPKQGKEGQESSAKRSPCLLLQRELRASRAVRGARASRCDRRRSEALFWWSQAGWLKANMRWLGLISVASVDGRWSAGPPPSRWQNFCRRQPLATTMMARPPVKNGGQNNARLSAPCQSVSNPCQSVSNPRPALGPWSIRAKVPRRTGPPVNASKSVKSRTPLGPLLSPSPLITGRTDHARAT